MSVEFDVDHRLWLLRTPESAYAFRLDEADQPRHVHWGPPLTLEQAAQIPSRRNPVDSSFDEPGDDRPELATEGGAFFGVAGLSVRFADGTQAVEWAYAGHDTGHDAGDGLVVRLKDRHFGLVAELHYVLRGDVVERHVVLRNTGTEPISLSRTDSAAWTLPCRDAYRVSHTTGAWSAEAGLRRDRLPYGETVLTSRRGITSHQRTRGSMVDDGHGHRGARRGVERALAWSGTWRIAVAAHARRPGRGTGGVGHDGRRPGRLAPGEAWTTPGLRRAVHRRRVRRRRAAPGTSTQRATSCRDADEPRPVLYNSWEATGFDVDEASRSTLARQRRRRWASSCSWWTTAGSARAPATGPGSATGGPTRDRFPARAAPLVDEVHGLGMRFGIWVEPEMVNPDSDLYRAHPDWVLHHAATATRTELRNQLVLNFARPDVADWALRVAATGWSPSTASTSSSGT